MTGIPTPHPKRVRSPWWVTIGAGFAMAVSAGPVVMSTQSLFVLPITEDTGWSRATVTAAFTFLALGQAVGTPVVGHLLDRFAFRWVVVPSWLLYCLCLTLATVIPHTLPLFYIPYLLAGLFASGTLIPFTKAVLSWFDNKRGTAVGVTASLFALGATLAPLLVSFLLTGYGWQATYRWLAVLTLVVSMVMVFGLVRVRAERSVHGRLLNEAQENDRTVVLELPGLSIREALRSRYFWVIAMSLCSTGACVVGIQGNLVPMMTDQGATSGQGAALLTVIGLTSLLGGILGGVLLDRFHAPYVCAAVIMCPVVGMFLLNAPLAGAAVGTALIGFAFGVEINLMPYLLSRYLGMRCFGTLLGLLQTAVMLASALGPLAVNLGFEVLGSYSAAMPFLAGLLLLCAALVVRLGRYPYPAVAGFDDTTAQDEFAGSPNFTGTTGTTQSIRPTVNPQESR